MDRRKRRQERKSNKKDYANSLYDQQPDAAWNNHWAKYSIGTTGGDPAFGSTDFANWFNNDYKQQMMSQWTQNMAKRGPDAKNMHLNEWLKRKANRRDMRSAWAMQPDMVRGLPGRTAARWMTV